MWLLCSKTERDGAEVIVLGNVFHKAVTCGKKRMLKMISMSIKLHERTCIAKYMVNGGQEVG